MKKLKKLISLTFVFMTLLFIGTTNSCTKPIPPKPDCELNNYGSVTVKNETGLNIWVDVTWGNVVENYEKLLYNGNSYKYNKIPAGSIEIWYTYTGNDWYYNVEYLDACEDMTYRWYRSGKGADSGISLDILDRSGTLIKTITKFESKIK